jgi:pimeloyl-ACP methyl ester carboxylesterase
MAERARVETVLGAGHDVHLDQPDRTARLIGDFIGG